MKRLITLLMLCICIANFAKAEVTDLTGNSNVIYIKPATAKAGETVKVSVNMKNTAAIRGFQFDLYLPDGVTIAVNAKGKTLVALSAGRLGEDDEHSLLVAKQEDGCYRFLCSSMYEETFLGNDGEIATVTLDIPAGTADGVYPIVIKNQKLSESDISKYYETETVETTLTIGSTGVKEVSASGNDGTADGKYLKDGRLVIKKDGKQYNAIGAGKK